MQSSSPLSLQQHGWQDSQGVLNRALVLARRAPVTAGPDETECERYFFSQLDENLRWARRMGLHLGTVFRPGITALDFGCGHGALAVQGAELGAHVVGIDTSARRIAFARRNAARAFPGLQGALEFMCGPIEDLPARTGFDVIVSKDTFKHAAGPDEILLAFRRLLRPGGRVYIGFSPLWHSPFGDHGFLTRRRIPWLHLLMGEARFVAAHNAHTGRADATVAGCGFNQISPGDFRHAVRRAGFCIEHARINVTSPWKRVALAPLDVARRLGALEHLATVNMYVTLCAQDYH